MSNTMYGRPLAGAPAQAYLPPGQEPKPPYIQYPMPKENR